MSQRFSDCLARRNGWASATSLDLLNYVSLTRQTFLHGGGGTVEDDDCGLDIGDRASCLCNGSLEFRKRPVPLAGHSQPSNVDAYLGRGVLLELRLRQTITGRNDETDASFRVDNRTFLQPSAFGQQPLATGNLSRRLCEPLSPPGRPVWAVWLGMRSTRARIGDG